MSDVTITAIKTPLSPGALKAINDFFDAEELEMRARLMGELVGYFLDADDVDDATARDYARALRLLEDDLKGFLRIVKTEEDD